jgi:protein gp37
MGKSKIEWTERTWNPTIGCNKVSAGCKNCYAEVMHRRLMKMQPEKYSRPFLNGAFPHEPSLEIPLHWKKPQRIFVNSMSDLFHEKVPLEFIAQVFAVMYIAEQHTFQILTKRPERMLSVLTNKDFSELVNQQANIFYNKYVRELSEAIFFDEETKPPLKNVWLGVSCENQETADERTPILLQIPAAIRWVSAEPLLGEIDFLNVNSGGKYLNVLSRRYSENKNHNAHDGTYMDFGLANYGKIDWVVAGGESGPGARPMHPDWVRKIRDDCKAAGVPFLFKQWGAWIPVYQHCAAGVTYVDGDVQFTKFKTREIESGIDGVRPYHVLRMGKKLSGRLLDGVLHDEYPEVK